jgi:outer membrane protein OmpA-like peptidoglycan-associated protein
MKKFVAKLTLLALTLVGLAGVSSPAHAALTVDVAGQTLAFKGTTTAYSSGVAGGFANDIQLFKNLATVGGVTIDAAVTLTKVSTSGTTSFTLDNDSGSAITTSASLTPPVTTTMVQNMLQTDVTPGAARGYLNMKFNFYEAGTYTGKGTGTPITLLNVKVNSYDLDYMSSSGSQFTDFRGFQSYTLSSNTTLTVKDNVADSNVPSGAVRFQDNGVNTGGYSATDGSYTKGRVQANFDVVTELSVNLGSVVAGLGKYALEFGPGYPWQEGSTSIGTNTTSNSYNTPPTSNNNSIYYSQGVPWVFSQSDFPYVDAENNPFTNVSITTLPGAGTLQYLNGATWTNVTLNQAILVSDILLGKLRYSGTTNTTFGFKVQDGQSYSTAAYTMTMNAAPNTQTINFPDPGAQAPSTTISNAASATSGLTVTLTSLTPGVCTVSGTSIITVAAGTCTVTATQAGNASYMQALPVTRSFPVSVLTSQTITFNTPATQTVGTPITVSPTSTSGLQVTVISLTPSVCTVAASGSSWVVTHLTTGICQLRGTQAGNSTYAPASNVDIQYLVNAGALTAQTITFAQPANINTTTTSVTVSATASSGLAVTFSSNTTSVCTVSGTTVTILTSGTCSITATQAGNSTYASATLTRTFYVLEVTTTSLANGGTGVAYSQTVGAFGGATGSYTWSVSPSLPAGLSLNTSTGAITGTPTVQQSATNYTFSVTDSGVTATKVLSITITGPVAQTITFPQPNNITTATTSITVSPTASSGLGVTISSSTPSVCTVSGNVITIVGPGTCTITASQAGSAAYSPTSLTRTFYVLAVTTTSLLNGQTGVAYSDNVAAAGGATGTYTWSVSPSLPAGLTLNTSTGAITGTPTVAQGATNYTFSVTDSGITATKVLSILIAGPGSQTITFPQPANINTAGGPVTLNPSSSSGLPVTLSSSTLSVCTVVGNVVTIVGPGTCTITATQSGSYSYSPASITRSFYVLGITTTSLANGAVNAAYSQTVVAVGGATGSYTWSVSPALPAGLTLNTSTGVVSGTPSAAQSATDYTFTVTDSGITATKVLSITILGGAAQTVTFPAPANQTINTGSITVNPSASSGLPVTLTSLTTSVCTVSGNVITFVGPGVCSITATQAGNASYAPASITRSFYVLAITTTSLNNGTAGSAYVENVAAAGGSTGTYTWSVSPSLPTGLTLNTSTGAITGTPANAQLATNYTFSVTNGGLTATKVLSITIMAPPPVVLLPNVITFGPIADRSVTSPNFTVSATASSGLAVSFSTPTSAFCTVSGNTVTIVAVGYCEIDASQAGNSTYAAAGTVDQSFYIFAITTGSIANGTMGTAYYQQLFLVNNMAPGTWTATSLPSGMTINVLTGEITGIPTVTYNGTITVTYTQGGFTHTVTYTLVIAAPANTPAPQPPVTPNNTPTNPNPVTLPPGNSFATHNYRPVPATLTPTTNKDGVNIQGQGWTLELHATDEKGKYARLNSKNQVVMVPGLYAKTSGTGFKPNTLVYVWMFAKTMLLGTLMTDANGEFTGMLLVPYTTTAGAHVIQVEGQTTDDQTRRVSVGVIAGAPSITDAIYFGGDSAKLTSSAIATLKLLATQIKAVGQPTTITLHGWVFKTADTSNDIRLATARGNAVKAALISFGVKASWVVVAMGIAPEAGPEARRTDVTAIFG